MVINVTPEQEKEYRELNRLRMKAYRDRKRVRKYSPRKSLKVPKSTEANTE